MTIGRGNGGCRRGAWTKELLNSAQGALFSLLRLAAGGEFTLAGSTDARRVGQADPHATAGINGYLGGTTYRLAGGGKLVAE